MLPKTKLLNNFLTVGLLQLIKEQYLIIQEQDKHCGKTQISFVITEKKIAKDTLTPVKELYRLLCAAAVNNVVTQKAFAKYLTKHKHLYLQLTLSYQQHSQAYGKVHGLFYAKSTKSTKTGDQKRDNANWVSLTLKGFQKKTASDELELNLVHLKNYLSEFTLLDERTPQETNWSVG